MKRLCIIISFLFASFSVSAATTHIKEVRWDRHSLIIDGERVCPVMGEIHYSRVPADEWQTEVRKMREGGVTIVATYVFWNHIEEEEGVFRWDGQRDLRRFLEVCKQEQMPVVLRMGPWCHGEVRNGGLPDWLFTKNCKMRSQDSTFLGYTARLYHQIFTQVQGLQWKDGGPVIAAQFDNEYRGPAEYLLTLKRIAIDCGFDLPFYTRTGWPELTTPMPFGEMLPLYGDYADGFWDKSTEEGAGSYYKAFNFKAFRNSTAIGTDFLTYATQNSSRTIEGDNSTYPYFTCELGGGMVTAYHRRPYIYPEDAYAMALVKLGSGSNLLGYYMYHGGTNPEGRLHTLNECQTSPFTANNDLPVCTYDFQAPLGEFGQAYPQYYMLRPLHLFMHDFGALLAPMEAQFPAPQDLKRGEDDHLRWSVRSDTQTPQRAFIFVNNYERLQTLSVKRNVQLEACGVKLPKLTIPSGAMAIFPINVEGMRYATAQLVAKRDGKTYLMQIPGIATTIALQNGKTLHNVKPHGTERPIHENLYLLTREQAEHLFLEENHQSSARPNGTLDTSRIINVQWTKLREAGPLRAIQKGKARVAEAPTEEDWQQAALYHISLPSSLIPHPSTFLSITYRGDCARLYANGHLIADNFYYGRPFLYGLWRLPEGCTELELRILPLQPDAPIYLPREADKRAGEEVMKVEISAQDAISLAGSWHLSSRFDASSVNLPGSLLTNGIGDDISVDTRWTGSLYDSSYYHNPFMARYRQTGQMKFPFFLTPRKHFVGEVTYSRTVNVPRDWKDRRVTLFLERPHIETTVIVNGHEVGHQMSLSVPHQYDVTPYLRFDKDNDIAIRVFNGIENVCVGQDSHSVTDQTQGNWNGIAGRIELQATPYIYRRRVTTDLATGTAHITLNDRTFDVHVPNARPWSEHSPQLYTAIINYDDTPVRVTFGFREVSISGPDILLNGQPIHLRGTVENCCFPETGYPPTDVASWERIFQKCKDYGLNHMRFHSYCPPDAAFTAADRLGFYLQPEGPSWPNHGVKLGNGMAIDDYLTSECKAILDTYGHHPSFIMLAAGNEPAGRWVDWGAQFVKTMKAHDPSRIYTTASVGGSWEWDYGSEYHVKGGARGLEWNQRCPSTDDDFTAQILHPRNYKGETANDQPLISHEQGQWCAFPDFREIPQYTGAYKAANFEIFRDLLAANGMAGQAEKFLMASGRLQVLAYKYEIERHLRTPHYAGFQLLSLNDYSGQGTALVGPLNVHWREKGYCTAEDWREFCCDVVPLAVLPRFTYSTSDTIRFNTLLYNVSGSPISEVSYEISDGATTLAAGQSPIGQSITFISTAITRATKLTLTLTVTVPEGSPEGNYSNHWNIWVYPQPSLINHPTLIITSSLDSALIALASGHDVLLCAAGRIRYGADVVHRFLPVFWNTSWFKMRPPHTTGAYIQADHPVFRDFPTDDWQDLQWWELTNRAQCINLAEFPTDYQPIVQPIDTWHLSRKLGMMVEARVGKGRLLLTTFDITNDLDHRIVARQLRQSIINYMNSDSFQPSLVLDPDILRHLFERDAPSVNMFTNDSPDELKPKLKN